MEAYLFKNNFSIKLYKKKHETIKPNSIFLVYFKIHPDLFLTERKHMHMYTQIEQFLKFFAVVMVLSYGVTFL